MIHNILNLCTSICTFPTCTKTLYKIISRYIKFSNNIETLLVIVYLIGSQYPWHEIKSNHIESNHIRIKNAR